MADENTAKDRVLIFDTTLRDGEQCPGATMTLKKSSKLPNCSTPWVSISSKLVFPIASIGDSRRSRRSHRL